MSTMIVVPARYVNKGHFAQVEVRSQLQTSQEAVLELSPEGQAGLLLAQKVYEGLWAGLPAGVKVRRGDA